MSRRVKTGLAVAAVAAAGAALVMSACESVPLTAAPGTELTLMANPDFVIANGGVSVVTAILVEPAGTFVPDGTEVFFYTNLGRVDASGKSRNGVVRVNFVSDARSGTAIVTAISGGAAPEPPPPPTTAPPQGAKAGVAARVTSVPRVFGASDVATDENQGSVEIMIGSARPHNVFVTASPAVLANARSATIVANVFDANGNPIQNVPVFFSIAEFSPPDAPQQEVLESGGAARYTDANGQAFDRLITRSLTGTTQKTVSVTATTATGESSTPVAVVINYSAAPTGR